LVVIQMTNCQPISWQNCNHFFVTLEVIFIPF
jgi:hypothetical protein